MRLKLQKRHIPIFIIVCGVLFLLKGIVGLMTAHSVAPRAHNKGQHIHSLEQLENDLSRDQTYPEGYDEHSLIESLPDYQIETKKPLSPLEKEMLKGSEYYIATSDLETLRKFVDEQDTNNDQAALNDFRTHLNLIMEESGQDHRIIKQLFQLVDIHIDNAESRSELMVLIYDAVPKQNQELKTNVSDELLSTYQLTDSQREYLIQAADNLPSIGRIPTPLNTDVARDYLKKRKQFPDLDDF